MKKIIIIGPAYPYRGGPARFNESMCKAFIENGIDAEIVSFKLQYPALLFPGTSQYEKEAHPRLNFKITEQINTINPLSWWKTALYINNKTKPDAVLFRYWLPFFAPAFGTITRLLNSSIKKIALTDNVLPHEKRIGDSILNKYFLNKCDGFIAMSEKVLNDLNLYTQNKNKLLLHHPLYTNYPALIDKQKARSILNIPANEKIILFFGLVRPYKGLDLLLEAMAENILKEYNFKLLIAGEFYDEKEKYIALINKYSLNEHIILKDYYIPDKDVNIYFSACDAVIQPYKSATNSGVSMVSYFYNKPIISTNVGGLKEIIRDGETGWLCNPNVKDMAQGIKRFLDTENKDLDKMQKNIEELKQEFSWTQFVTKIIHFIEHIQK